MLVVAVMLVASIVTIVNSIDLTVLTMYGYQRYFTVVTPRNSLTVGPETIAVLARQPLAGRRYTARPAFTVAKTVFGKMPLVLFGLSEEGRGKLMERCGLALVSGRMPRDGVPEVALSEEIARNRGLRLGDAVLQPDSEDSFARVPVRLCGTLRGKVWLCLTSERFIAQNFPVSPTGFVLLAKDVGQQAQLDAAVKDEVDNAKARVWTFARLVEDTRDALSSLYLVMNIVIGIIVFSIAFLTGMLANIHFTQRLPEFATLVAIGYRRAQLGKRVLMETGLLCAAGWLLGALGTVALLISLRDLLLEPRGLLLDPFDWRAYLYTLPLPIGIVSCAIAAIGRSLLRLDPVSVIERRQ